MLIAKKHTPAMVYERAKAVTIEVRGRRTAGDFSLSDDPTNCLMFILMSGGRGQGPADAHGNADSL